MPWYIYVTHQQKETQLNVDSFYEMDSVCSPDLRPCKVGAHKKKAQFLLFLH